MAPKNIKFKEEARQKILKGVKTLELKKIMLNFKKMTLAPISFNFDGENEFNLYRNATRKFRNTYC